jgi:lysophospholipase L1-like esterase
VSKLISGEYDNVLNVKFPNLNGKKVVFFGDSITAAGIYEAEFAELSGCIVYNRGVGGTTFAKISSSLLWNDSLSDRVDKAANESTSSGSAGLPSNPDLIYLFAGINDWGRVAKNNETPVPAGGGSYQPEDYITGERFGDISIEDNTTFCGAVRYVMRKLKTKYPSIPIIVVLPLHTYSPNSYPLWSELNYATANDESSAWEVQKTTDDGKTLYDYRNAIKELAQEFGLPVVDTFEMGITPILSTDKTAYYNEGLHPNSTGYHLLGKFIYEQLSNQFLTKTI